MNISSFKCYRVRQNEGKIEGQLEISRIEELSPGDVIIRAHYSSINYKDALGLTGRGKIIRKFPLVGGIDVSGEVVFSQSAKFHKGQKVLITGCGMGESADGGYSEYVRVPAEWIVPLPEGLSTQEAMILGTAGLTAGLCLWRLQANGQTPQQGPILVTGASGGVGMMAIQLLSQLNYQVIALSGKTEHWELLRELGASEVLSPDQLQLGAQPLESSRWAGAIDNVGGSLLSRLLAHIDLWGNIACVGLAGGAQLNATVFPLILRGVSLLGVSSTNCPMNQRMDIWNKLATSWRPKSLSRIHQKTIPLNELDQGFAAILDRKNIGRILVQCS